MTNLPVVRAGKTYNIYWKLSIPNPAPPVYRPYSPQLETIPLALPQISIFDPSGTKLVDAANMTQVLDNAGNAVIGTYLYSYQTPVSPLGIYSCWVDLSDPASNPAGSADQQDQSETTPFAQVV